MSLLLQESSRPYERAVIERGTLEFGSGKRSQRTHRVASIRRLEATARMDEDLAGLAQRGDAHAFGELVERHFTTCFKRAFLILRDRNDAEDEVQNAFAKAFENLHQFRFEGTFSAWLCRIVQNLCLMRLRQRRQTGFVSVDATPDSSGKLELVNQVASPEDELGAREVDHLLRIQISRIPPLMRAVILLRDVEELPMGEVAERLGLSVPAAKSRLMRARKEMRNRLSKHCGRNGQQTLTHKATYHRAEYIQCG